MMNFCLCRFLEYGEYKDNLYGTSLESIHKVLAQNKVCLMDVQPEVSDPQLPYVWLTWWLFSTSYF